jgi:hypothetical protein
VKKSRVKNENVSINVQSDQKENKSEQALQIIIGHVVAKSDANKRRQFVVSNAALINHTYLMHFRRWNYNCAFYYYYYYLIMEKIYKINKSNILHFL